MHDYEKLGAFYLGRRYDLAANRVASDEPLLYDAKDLCTHAVIVGMTGSGKTGLAVTLLEEAAIDGIPVIAIDPKGDLGNLLLTFPSLDAASFRPWIDEAEAARHGRTPDAEAQAVADRWRDGLAEWGQAPERIARFAAAADRAIYTPGSQRRTTARAAAFAPRAGGGGGGGRGRAARAGAEHRLGPARPGRRRRGSAPQPRAHPRLDAARPRLARRQGPRSRRADRAGAEAAARARRRARPRVVLPAKERTQLALRAEQPRRLADLRRLGRGRAARRRAPALHGRRHARGSRSSRSRISPTPSACSW